LPYYLSSIAKNLFAVNKNPANIDRGVDVDISGGKE
jgi:hypothetical protein